MTPTAIALTAFVIVIALVGSCVALVVMAKMNGDYEDDR